MHPANQFIPAVSPMKFMQRAALCTVCREDKYIARQLNVALLMLREKGGTQGTRFVLNLSISEFFSFPYQQL